MERLELSADTREIIGKHVKQLRAKGLVPANVFGHAITPISIQIREKEFRAILAAGGGSRLITLNIQGQAQPTMALVREIQRDVLTTTVQHVDFQAVVMTEKIRTTVGLVTVGQSPAVAEGLGALFQMLDAVEIEALPGDLIPSIEVDISGLTQIDEAVYVRDLQVPDTVKIVTAEDEMIARITHIATMEEEEEEEVEEVGEPEVIRRAREEDEE